MSYSYVPLHNLTDEQWESYFCLYSSRSNPWYKSLAALKSYYFHVYNAAVFSRIYFIFKNDQVKGNLVFNIGSTGRPEDASVYTGSLGISCPQLNLYLLQLIIKSMEEYGKEKLRIEVKYKILKDLFSKGNMKLLKKMNFYSIEVNEDIISGFKKIVSENNNKFQDLKIDYYTSIPEGMLGEYCSLFTEFVRQVPGMNEGDLNYVYTPEEYQKVENDGQKNGWTALYMMVYNSSSKTVGMLSTIYNPQVQSVLHVITALRKEFRGMGLSKYLKALLYNELLKRNPEIKRISTQNYETNTVINKINLDMGFELIQEELEFDVNVKDLKDLYCKLQMQQPAIAV